MILGILKQLAHAFANHFGNNCEVVVYDISQRTLDHSLVYIENGHVTGRQIGDGPSNIVLEMYKKGFEDVQSQIGYFSKTSSGKTLKSTVVFIRETPEAPVKYIFGINYDMTNILAAYRDLGSWVKEFGFEEDEIQQENTREHKPLFTNVADLLDDLLRQSVDMIGKPVEEMNKEEKVKAIHFLDSLGAFLITRSGDRVSQYFGISKFTLYNYLKAD